MRRNKKIFYIIIALGIFIIICALWGTDLTYDFVSGKLYGNRTFQPILNYMSYNLKDINKSNFKKFEWESIHLGYKHTDAAIRDRIFFLNDTVLFRQEAFSPFNRQYAISYIFGLEKYGNLYNSMWRYKNDSIYFIYGNKIGRGYELKYNNGKIIIGE